MSFLLVQTVVYACLPNSVRASTSSCLRILILQSEQPKTVATTDIFPLPYSHTRGLLDNLKNTHDSTVSLYKEPTIVLLLKDSCQRSPCEALLGDYEVKTTIALTVTTCVLVQDNWVIATCEMQALSCPRCH